MDTSYWKSLTTEQRRGTYPICLGSVGQKYKIGHIQTCHPEFKFKNVGGTIRCGLCDTTCGSVVDGLRHYSVKHPGMVKCNPDNRHDTNTVNIPDPVMTIDNFFNNIHDVTEEVKRLRAECVKQKENAAYWEKLALKWSARIVELQDILGRKS